MSQKQPARMLVSLTTTLLDMDDQVITSVTTNGEGRWPMFGPSWANYTIDVFSDAMTTVIAASARQIRAAFEEKKP